MRNTWENIPGEMFDFQKFYTQMANEMYNDCRVCEVGVADGKSAIFLAEQLANQGKKFQLTLVDNLAYGGNKQQNEILRNVQRSGLSESINLIIPRGSLDASTEFPDEYFNFVFLDSSHDYSQTKAEIRLWWKKIYPNGFLAGHDAYDELVNRALQEVIPKEFLSIEQTSKGFGTWCIRNSNGAHLKY